jgi:hypothetical protein
MNISFQFDQDVINEFWLQLGTFVDNLSSVYHFGTVCIGRKCASLKRKCRAAIWVIRNAGLPKWR